MKRAFWRCLLLCLGLFSSSALQAESPVKSSEFIYESAPFPSVHATTIVETTQGTLIASFFGGTAEGKNDVGIWLSRKLNGKWDTPREIATGHQPDGSRLPCWNPVLFQSKDGPLRLFYKVGPSPSTWWGEMRASTDDGLNWHPAVRLPEGVPGPIKNKPVQLPNGDVLSGSSSEHDGWRVHFERSLDGGRTWIATAPVNDGQEFAAIQPSILLLGGDKLLAVGRTKQKTIFEIESNDLGRTWGPMKAGTLPNPNSGTDALTMKDGRHLIVFNNTPKGRSPLNVAISKDGHDWKPVVVLESEPGEYSYPAVIQTQDGLIHITYTWKRQKVKHVVIDPAKLVVAWSGYSDDVF